MSQKFIGLDAAAEQLGVPKERLNELREAGDLRAYRDGASWKFRTEEIDKMASEGVPAPSGDDDLEMDMTLDLGGADDDGADIDLGVEPLSEGDEAESILLTEGELEGGLPRPPSTIIGKTEPSEDDDLSLSPPSSEAPAASFEGVGELELDLEAESSRILESKDIAAAKAAAQDQGLAGESELELDLGSAAPVIEGSDPANAGDPSATGELPPGSVAGLSGLDKVELGDDEEDDVVLGGSDDLSLSGSDSGINLAPSDSGIALDEVPLDLAGSAIGSALDIAALSAASGVGSGADLKEEGDLASGEDFLLTPTPGDEGEEEDSSQVVALEEIAEEEDVVAFTPDGEEDEEDDWFGFGGESALEGDLAAGGPAVSAVGAPAAPAAAEATFPLWIMLLMGGTLLSMTLCGMFALDLIQSIWSWDEPYGVNSAMMDGILGLFGG